ncbi:hypothetical protein [Melioribacter roseus]|nr:hypothetical protein [Melioribacter roseus]
MAKYGNNANYVYSFLVNKFPANNFETDIYYNDPIEAETMQVIKKITETELPDPIEVSEELKSISDTGVYVREYKEIPETEANKINVDEVSIGFDLPDNDIISEIKDINPEPINNIPDTNIKPIETTVKQTSVKNSPMVYIKPGTNNISVENVLTGKILVSKGTVQFLRRLLNPRGLERTLNNLGFPVDLLPAAEKYLSELSETSTIKNEVLDWIKNNYTYFINGDIDEVTKSLNNYLLLDPYVISVFGYPIEIYSDPYHLRQYILYGLGGLAGFMILRKLLK